MTEGLCYHLVTHLINLIQELSTKIRHKKNQQQKESKRYPAFTVLKAIPEHSGIKMCLEVRHLQMRASGMTRISAD